MIISFTQQNIRAISGYELIHTYALISGPVLRAANKWPSSDHFTPKVTMHKKALQKGATTERKEVPNDPLSFSKRNKKNNRITYCPSYKPIARSLLELRDNSLIMKHTFVVK